jgi:hypothetical protein
MDVKYYTIHNYPDLYFFKPAENERFNFMSYVFSHVDTDTATTDTLHRVDLTFELHQEKVVPASENTKPFSVEKNSQGYLNYFLPQCPQGITGVDGFNKLLYPSVFDSTDILFYGNNKGMKFYIIVKPGGAYDVGLNFDGQDSITIIGDTVLNIHTSIATYSYPRPDVFQIDANGDRVDLAWQGEYVDWGNGRVGFYIGSIDGSLPMVIEVGKSPTASAIGQNDWSTFFGGTGNDEVRDLDFHSYFSDEWTYYTGKVTVLPIPSQWVQYTSNSGYEDAFIAKFDKDCILEWQTYYGGNAYDYGNSITESNNYIGITGGTNSTGTSLPHFPGTQLYNEYLQTTYAGGGSDAFAAIFDASDGHIIYSTYFGGSGYDVGSGIAFKSENGFFNAYIVGSTNTSAGDTLCHVPTNGSFPLCPSTGPAYFQKNYGGGSYDGFIAKLNLYYGLVWSTYYGGNGDDRCNGIYIDAIGDINPINRSYVTGVTSSQNGSSTHCVVPTTGNFPLCNQIDTACYFQTQYGGGSYDAFIAAFDTARVLNWSTYFGGDGDDQSYDVGVAYSTYDRIAIGGKTSSNSFSCYPSCNCDVPANGDFPLCNPGGGAYFQNDGSGNPMYGGGNSDAFIAVFDKGKLIWSTYFGGSGEDVARGVSNVEWFSYGEYLTGYTNSDDDFPVQFSQGRYYLDANNNPATYDAFIAEFYTPANVSVPAWGLEWSTFYGGAGDDYSYSVAAHYLEYRHVYIAGKSIGTGTPAFPLETPIPGLSFLDINLEGTDGIMVRFGDTVTVGINEPVVSKGDNIIIYPNPGNDIFVIESPYLSGEKISITVTNVLGQIVYSEKMKNIHGKLKKKINLSSVAPGLYLISLKTEKNIATAKIIKQ